MSNNNIYATQQLPQSKYMVTSNNHDIEICLPPPEAPVKPTKAEFVNKVLNYVCAQLTLTTIITMYMYVNRTNVIDSVEKNNGLVWFPIIMSFGTLTWMVCDKENIVVVNKYDVSQEDQ